jgi:tetratricopeptide (TPR) repeat protein
MAALAAFSLSGGIAAANCELQQLGVLPVDMQGLRPVVSAEINGVKARFVLDSGDFYSTISRDAAVQYKLPVTPAPGKDLYIIGVGGIERADIATAASFEFLGVSLPNAGFMVVDQSPAGDLAGLLGQNLLRISDVEFDLANGIVRFIRPVGCERQPLAYWAVSTPYSFVDLQYMDVVRSNLQATATIDGHRITVMFDTGASRSLLSLQAAQRLGITPSSPGVIFLGMVAGIGPAVTKAWVAPVDTFQIGGEKVEHTHLPIGNLGPDRPTGYVGDAGPDMLLGEDFFLSHRIYVSYGQRKLYFTYNGGPLFNLDVPKGASGTATPPPAARATQQASTAGEQPASDAPTDADGFRRRGMARASMHEFDQALADLTRACELAPRDADDRYDRGMIYAEEGQFKSAVDDFNTAITLQPDDADAHLARAELLQSHPDVDPAATAADVKPDLDAVSRAAAPAATVHLTLAELYGGIGDYSATLEEVDLWLSQHRDNENQAKGLNARCRLRASANRDLQSALDDCNRALALRPFAPETLESRIRRALAAENPDILDSRGLVYLRLGRLKEAVHDYDAALQGNPDMPNSLYGRGLAELRLGEKTQAQSDLVAAAKLDGGTAKRFAKMGLTP